MVSIVELAASVREGECRVTERRTQLEDAARLHGRC
jgi:hypothetical protein